MSAEQEVTCLAGVERVKGPRNKRRALGWIGKSKGSTEFEVKCQAGLERVKGPWKER